MNGNKEFRIENYDGVQKAIDTLTEFAQSGSYVFRGYGKQDELLPNIIRNKNYEDVEDALLKDFERYGSHYFHANTPIDFMSYAQHFGLPTRLLDFTYNPFIALSFALYGPKSNGKYSEPNDKNYYYIRYASIDDNICLSALPLIDDIYQNKITRTDSLAARALQCIDNVSDLFGKNIMQRSAISLSGLDTIEKTRNIQQKLNDRVILFIDPNQSNQRIIMQQGLFMFPYTLVKEEHIKIIEQNTSIIMIHKDLRNKLLQFLETLGFTSFRLMPDIASVCAAVRRKVVDERNSRSENFKKKATEAGKYV